MKKGTKHLIQCHCVLPQYRQRKEPLFHKIEVFSTISDDEVDEKFVICDNCGSVHRVYDMCKSEIVTNHEMITSVKTIPEIKMSFDDDVSNLLEKNNCHVSTWENVEFIIDNNLVGFPVIINRENLNGKTSIKILELKNNGKFKVSNEIIENEVTFEWY